jgi:hypothetical protein
MLASKYERTKNKDGTNDEFVAERDMMNEYFDKNMPMNRDMNPNNLKFSPTYKSNLKGNSSSDEFLKGFDEQDEEITLKLVQYLHKNPLLFAKIRVLQRKNKILNPEEQPEIRRLQVIKQNIVSLLDAHQI